MRQLKDLRKYELIELSDFFNNLDAETVRKVATRLFQAQIAFIFMADEHQEVDIIKARLVNYIVEYLSQKEISEHLHSAVEQLVKRVVDEMVDKDLPRIMLFDVRFAAACGRCCETNVLYFVLDVINVYEYILKEFYQKKVKCNNFAIGRPIFEVRDDAEVAEIFEVSALFYDSLSLRGTGQLRNILQKTPRYLGLLALALVLGNKQFDVINQTFLSCIIFIQLIPLIALRILEGFPVFYWEEPSHKFISRFLAAPDFAPLFSNKYNAFIMLVNSAIQKRIDILEQRKQREPTKYERYDGNKPTESRVVAEGEGSSATEEVVAKQGAAKLKAVYPVIPKVLEKAYPTVVTFTWNISPSNSVPSFNITYREGDLNTNVYKLWGKTVVDDTYYLYWQENLPGFTSHAMHNHFQLIAEYGHIVAPVGHSGIVMTNEKEEKHPVLKLKSESRQFGDFRVYCRFFAETEHDHTRRILYQTSSVEREEGHKCKNN